jgi:hypothetical protein
MAVTTFEPEADATISESAADTNFGGLGTLLIGNQFGVVNINSRALLRFDVASLVFQDVSAATLGLTPTGAGSLSEPGTFFAYRIAQTGWTGGGVTWNKRNGVSNWATAGLGAGTDYVTADGDTASVTDENSIVGFLSLAPLVADALVRSGKLELLVIGPEDTGDNDFTVVESAEGTIPPTLTVTYTPLPVIERIARCLAYRLARVTQANGYSHDLSVVRPTRKGTPDRAHGKCLLTQAPEPLPAEEHDVAGNPPGVAALQVFTITVHVAAADNDSTPVETVGNIVAAEAKRAIAAETIRAGVDWAFFEGLAIGAGVSEPQIEFDGQFVTAELDCSIIYRVSEVDPYVTR